MGIKTATYSYCLKRKCSLWTVQFCLVGVILLMFARPLLPIVDYFQNYDYIVNVLCENKEKPLINCNGKCYLSKLLAEEAEDESNPFSEKLSKYEIPLLLHEDEFAQVSFEPKHKKTFGDLVMTGGILYSLDLTRPPEASLI